MLVEFRELGLSLVGKAERVSRQGEGLAPVTALLRGEEDGRDLTQRVQRFSIVVLHRGAIDKDEVRVRRADGFEVGSTDGAQNRDVTRTIDKVVGDRLLAAARDDTNRGHAQGERIVGRGLRERHDAAGVRREGDLLAGRVGHGARLGRVGHRGGLGGRGRGRLGGRASSQGESGQSDANDGANSRRQVHECLNSVDLIRCIGKPNLQTAH